MREIITKPKIKYRLSCCQAILRCIRHDLQNKLYALFLLFVLFGPTLSTMAAFCSSLSDVACLTFKTILIESEHVFAPRIPISKRYVSTVISFSRK